MPSLYAEKAISEALSAGKAIIKFISRNDVGETGGHQCGFYMPKNAWQLYIRHAPQKGFNHKADVNIRWQDGRITESVITWYGKKTRSEYRLTRFGRDFPFLTSDSVGSLLVLIPLDYTEFSAYVLDHDDDIESIQSVLGIQVFTTWGIYQRGELPLMETEDECLNRHFRTFVSQLTDFPKSEIMSKSARDVFANCNKSDPLKSADVMLMKWMESEYRLFRMLERKIYQEQIRRLFKDVDEFLKIASSIMNRRKARAGLSLENHFEFLLKEEHIPFARQAKIDGAPDILIPGVNAYKDRSFSKDKLIVVGLKTTCKDRWRQVLNEGKRIKRKFILTLQPGISHNQLVEMKNSNICLIVPETLQKEYPADTGMKILSVADFIKETKNLFN